MCLEQTAPAYVPLSRRVRSEIIQWQPLEGVAIAPRLGLQALTRISRTIRSWPLHHRSDKSLNPHPRSG